MEVQNPIQALKSVKGPGNTSDLSPKYIEKEETAKRKSKKGQQTFCKIYI
jgi:hypothetical protein